MALGHHAVLAAVSRCYPPSQDRYLRVTHPSATRGRNPSCDLHVLSMPPAFALSQDQTLRFISLETKVPSLTNKIPSLIPGIINASLRLNENFTSVSVTHQKNTRQTRPLVFIPDDRTKSNPVHHPAENPILPHTRVQNSKDAANVSLPSLFDFQRAKAKTAYRPHLVWPTDRICFA